MLVGLLTSSCSSAKFLEKDEYLLSKVKVKSVEKKKVDESQLSGYIRQRPNSQWFDRSWLKVPLGIYSLSSKSGSSWLDYMLRRMGEEPVKYDKEKSERSCKELELALQNMGYLGARVEVEEVYNRHKVSLTYLLYPGQQYRVDSVRVNVADSVIAQKLQPVMAASLLKPNMMLNVNVLDAERERITGYLKEQGYYKFSKDDITYTVDTIQGKKSVGLTMSLGLYKADKNAAEALHPVFTIDSVLVVSDRDIANVRDKNLELYDRTTWRGIDIFQPAGERVMRPSVFLENIFLREGDMYRDSDVRRTHSSMGRLGALKYANVQFAEKAGNRLDAYIQAVPTQLQGFTMELDGTTTAGDFGAAASVSYQHKNLFKGSETFTIRLHGAFEAISGLQGYDTDLYTDWGVDVSLNFPRFMFPFVSSGFMRDFRPVSEVSVMYNTQVRPEFSRRLLSASWRYRWTSSLRAQHRFDLLDINYVYMPSISATFRDEYLNNSVSNSILKYNYEDLFIVRIGHSFSYSSVGTSDAAQKRNNYSIRTNLESAGNVLNLLSRTLYDKRSPSGQYAIGNIAYAQYLKGDVEYIHHLVIDKRNSISFRASLGIAYPYGNSTILPFEKRYFSGGANSVRGWSVRSLGPGSFAGDGKNIDFINQTGDVKLDLNAEYRTLLFWKLNGAVFIDAGNIWTLREYEEQPGGAFHFDTFLNQIAVAYGLGFRLDFNWVVLRLDFGMKAINPVFPIGNKNHFPILHPSFNRDFNLHFAVGYPF